jgi:aspartyl-tRNA(Asn)/glutamyl-tRNA(Gln) amidotransferase subunit C
VEDVRRIAKLARLNITDEDARLYQTQLSAVLVYMDRLREVNLEGVEPPNHPGGLAESANRLDEDAPRTPGSMFSVESLMSIAPDTIDGFVKVPKVLAEP